MPTQTTASINRVIEIDGDEISMTVNGQIESVLVVDRLAMPDMFAIVFRDPDPSEGILKAAGLEIGKKVTISTTSTSDEDPQPLITGEVTSIEADYDTLGARAVVRGYDKSHRLAAGRKAATFQNVKYSDIASQLASDAGLDADTDDSGQTFDHVLQANQSDLDFLYALAREIGFDCRVDDETLLFKKPTPSSEAPSEGSLSNRTFDQLIWGDNLREIHARVSAVAQVSTVQVRGWDVTSKEAVIGEAHATATNVELTQPLTAADLADKNGSQTLVVVDHPVDSQDGADELARARGDQIWSAGFEATAVVDGEPRIKAGMAVHISGVDRALCGKWAVTGTRHEFGDGSYRTFIECSGRQDRSIHGVLNNGSTPASGRIAGVVIAIVTDNADPDELGRVKLSYPWLSDDEASDWARVAAPGAGKDSGIVWLPQVHDEVLVAFEQGDVRHPIVLGGLWNGKDLIPFNYDEDLDAGDVTFCGFKSRSGHTISFWESSSDSSIQLLTNNSAVNIVLDETNSRLLIETKGKVVLDAKGDVEIKAGGSMKLEATGQMTIKGATVALN